jgi:Amt family ammonium transporter
VAADAQGPGGAIAPAEPKPDASPEEKAKYAAWQEGIKNPAVAGALESSGQNRIAINMVWLLVTGFLVMFMQAGFAMVETGFCRKKNAAHVMMTNFMIYPIGMLGFYLVGYSIMFGAGSYGGIGSIGGTPPLAAGHTFGPMINNVKMSFFGWNTPLLMGNMYDTSTFAFFLFQMVFMDTTCTIPTGAMAERWKFSAFVVYGFFISMIIYPVFGHWAWGGGWLASMGQAWGLGNGYVDFAGSGVVHAVGGFVGLAGALALGPRIGKYDSQGKPVAMPGHNLPMAMVGTFILCFGWFGFNPGSTFGAAGGGLLRIGVVATVTMLAGSAGAFAAMAYTWIKYKKPDPSMCVNGMLAGLVGITAPSGFVDATGAMIIGLVAGILVCLAVPFFDSLKIDDPVGAISVHGVNGLFGVLAVGIFSNGKYGAGWNLTEGVDGGVTGILYGGTGAQQLMCQIIGALTIIVVGGGLSYTFFKLQNKWTKGGIRPTREDELAGLDLPEMGVAAYNMVDATPIDTPPAAISGRQPAAAGDHRS